MMFWCSNINFPKKRATGALNSCLVHLCIGLVLFPFSTPCQIITPLIEIAIWLPNPNPSHTPNPNPTKY